jgi:hypothetical protein
VITALAVALGVGVGVVSLAALALACLLFRRRGRDDATSRTDSGTDSGTGKTDSGRKLRWSLTRRQLHDNPTATIPISADRRSGDSPDKVELAPDSQTNRRYVPSTDDDNDGDRTISLMMAHKAPSDSNHASVNTAEDEPSIPASSLYSSIRPPEHVQVAGELTPSSQKRATGHVRARSLTARVPSLPGCNALLSVDAQRVCAARVWCLEAGSVQPQRSRQCCVHGM